MVQTKVTLPPAEILQGTPSVAFQSQRNAAEGVPYTVTPAAGKLNHAEFSRESGYVVYSRDDFMLARGSV